MVITRERKEARHFKKIKMFTLLVRGKIPLVNVA
jgi:hypothetical protein